jgi:hypothetical protein
MKFNLRKQAPIKLKKGGIMGKILTKVALVSILVMSPVLMLGDIVQLNQGKTTSNAEAFQSPELLQLAKDFRQWRHSFVAEVPDYIQVVKDQRKGLAEFRRKLEAIDPHPWPVTGQVDYLMLQIEMNALEFDLEVIRQVSRNPDFYTTQAVQKVTRHIGGRYQNGAGVTVPYDEKRAQAIIDALNNTSQIIEQASRALTEAVPEMADMAIERLENVRQSYAEFATVVGQHLPEPYRSQLGPAADRAGKTLEDYRQWLMEKRPQMKAPYPIGREAFEWYVRNVLAWPYNSEQLLMQAEMERHRNYAFLQFERQKNSRLNQKDFDLPRPGSIKDHPTRRAKTMQEYMEWKDATDVISRIWAREYDLFTHPEYLGPMRNEEGGVYIEPFGFMAFPKEPKEQLSKREFLVSADHWITYEYNESGHWIDPGTNHPHSDYPGHTFENAVSQRTCKEIRRGHNTRGDAWCTYMEELQLQLDYPFLRGPLMREWMYSLALERSERVYVAVKFADGSMKPNDVYNHMMNTVPWMDPICAKTHEVWRLFSSPAYVLTYQVGKSEIYKLLQDRMIQLGDKFDFSEFHDQLFATGQIPITLARWEMAGIDDDIKHLWKREPLPKKKK